MLNIIRKEMPIEEGLQKKLDIAFSFASIKPKYINGSIRKVDKTNLSYIEPHRIIVNNKTFLVFNYSDDVYIGNLNKKIKISELNDYLKTN